MTVLAGISFVEKTPRPKHGQPSWGWEDIIGPKKQKEKGAEATFGSTTYHDQIGPTLEWDGGC